MQLFISYLCVIGNWELGIGNWASGIGETGNLGIGETGNSGLGIGHELSSKKVKLKITHFIFLLLHYPLPITNAQCPMPNSRLPITKFILANRRLSLADKIVNEAAVLLQSFRYPISVITVGEDMNDRFARIGQD